MNLFWGDMRYHTLPHNVYTANQIQVSEANLVNLDLIYQHTREYTSLVRVVHD